MKAQALIFCFVCVMVPVATASAQQVYVSSRVGTILGAPDSTATRVGVVRQGDSLDVVALQDGWYQVETDRLSGYIQEQFVGETPPAGRDASAGLQSVSSVTTRRRASAYTTSAAATRGLSQDNPRERQNLSFNEYDFTSVRWVKAFTYDDDVLIEFAQTEGLGL
jgi:hypothetical protein